MSEENNNNNGAPAFDFNSLKGKLESQSKTPLVRKIHIEELPDRPLWIMKMASRHLAALYAARKGEADVVSDFADYLNTKVWLDETLTIPLATREQLMDLSPEAISSLFDKIQKALPSIGEGDTNPKNE